MDPGRLKKPKLEGNFDAHGDGAIENGVDLLQEEEEEALVTLVEHRTKECEHLRQKIAHYKSQLEVAERRLSESKTKLSRLRLRTKDDSTSTSSREHLRPRSTPPVQESSQRPQLLIPPPVTKKSSAPGANIETPHAEKLDPPSAKLQAVMGNTTSKQEAVSRSISGNLGSSKKDTKRKLEQKEHQDLIQRIRTSASPKIFRFQSGTAVSSQHKRKLRSLELCPVNDHLLVTSALDGFINLWEVQGKGSSISLLSSSDCASPKQRRWPEDIAWHPDGDHIFATYTADGGDNQIAIMNLNASRQNRVSFLEQKPHRKGIINNIMFMPWMDTCFVTGGSDHAVILWQETDDSWKPKIMHGNQHSSAVMGVAGLQQKKVVVSVGADKRIIAFDLSSGRSNFKHQIDTKCMSVLPNPSDFNLFLVQTGTPGKQLRLYDIRLRQTEIHAFGWKQESSDSQSALINQSWSPNGMCVSSGSADPMIHIFDIRYDCRNPSQSVQAHQKRVFKAIWHQSLPLLTSISSDLNIGLHRMIV